MSHPNDPGYNPKGPIQRYPGSAQPITRDPKSVDQGHQNSDVNSSKFAQHHSLGHTPNQASPGDHIHDGSNSKAITALDNLAIASIFSAANFVFGSVSITPVANTPTFASVTYALPASCTTFFGFTTPFTGSPGTQVTGTAITNITATTANIFITRTVATATIVYYLIVGF